VKTFRTLINGKNPSRIEFFDSHISMLRQTSQEAHSHISSVPDIHRANEQELTAVPDCYQPLEQERFTAWSCTINHPYDDKSILREERGMCCCGLLWLRHRSGCQKKSIVRMALYTFTVLLCELWQFMKPFPALSIFWVWYFLFSCIHACEGLWHS